MAVSTQFIGAVPHARAVFLRSPPHHAAPGRASLPLQKALERADLLQQALTSSRLDLVAAQQQVAILSKANAHLSEVAVQRERDIAKAHHLAYHDKLTGLPNRALLLDRLQQGLNRAKRRQTFLALLVLDLDGFKNVNDTLGHAAGDSLLQHVAERLQSCTRRSDTVCRYGGDEFVLLLPEIEDRNFALDVAQKVGERLAKPYLVHDTSIAVPASIGVAVYPTDARCQGKLISQADVAMYRAKSARRRAPGHTYLHAQGAA